LPSGPFREFKFAKKRANLILKEDIDFKRLVEFENLTDKMLLVTAIANPKRLNKFLPSDVVDKYAKSILVTQKDYVKMEHFKLPINIEIVKTLLDALPYIKKFRDDIIVVKYGGSAQTSEELKSKFAEDIALLHTVGMKPVVVHGGGKSITNLLSDLNIDTKFIDGQRVTTREVMRIAEMVLSGEVNKDIVSLLNSQGAKAIGISGKDADFIRAIPKDSEKFGLGLILMQI